MRATTNIRRKQMKNLPKAERNKETYCQYCGKLIIKEKNVADYFFRAQLNSGVCNDCMVSQKMGIDNIGIFA